MMLNMKCFRVAALQEKGSGHLQQGRGTESKASTNHAQLGARRSKAAAQSLSQPFDYLGSNPPTPPGSTGCEIASGCPPLSPHPGFRWSRAPPPWSPPPPLLNPVGQKAPAARPSVIPKAKYMTLGPNFFLL